MITSLKGDPLKSRLNLFDYDRLRHSRGESLDPVLFRIVKKLGFCHRGQDGRVLLADYSGFATRVNAFIDTTAEPKSSSPSTSTMFSFFLVRLSNV